MKMRWYQQRTQGGSSMISLKKSAPSVDAVAMTQAAKTSAQAESDALLDFARKEASKYL